MIRRNILPLVLVFAAVFTWMTFSGPASADQAQTAKGQTLYVPAYTYINYGDRQGKIKLNVTLSIRNISLDTPITVSTVDYIGGDGKKIRSYLKQPIALQPLASGQYAIKESDLEGGLGTGFLVTWQSDSPVPPPVVQAVMIGAESTQGISFVTHGRVIVEQKK
jgi:hypothetical protein